MRSKDLNLVNEQLVWLIKDLGIEYFFGTDSLPQQRKEQLGDGLYYGALFSSPVGDCYLHQIFINQSAPLVYKTIIHELAHLFCQHHITGRGLIWESAREVIAESIANRVCYKLSLPMNPEYARFLKHHKIGVEPKNRALIHTQIEFGTVLLTTLIGSYLKNRTENPVSRFIPQGEFCIV